MSLNKSEPPRYRAKQATEPLSSNYGARWPRGGYKPAWAPVRDPSSRIFFLTFLPHPRSNERFQEQPRPVLSTITYFKRGNSTWTCTSPSVYLHLRWLPLNTKPDVRTTAGKPKSSQATSGFTSTPRPYSVRSSASSQKLNVDAILAGQHSSSTTSTTTTTPGHLDSTGYQLTMQR